MNDPSRCFHRLTYLAEALRNGSMRAAGDALNIAPSVSADKSRCSSKSWGLSC
jgi:hypothetical protein